VYGRRIACSIGRPYTLCNSTREEVTMREIVVHHSSRDNYGKETSQLTPAQRRRVQKKTNRRAKRAKSAQ